MSGSPNLQMRPFVKQRDQRRDDDLARQEILFGYLDNMAEAMSNGLLEANPGSSLFVIAQTRTVTALSTLDSERQSSNHSISTYSRSIQPSKAKARTPLPSSDVQS